MGTAVEKLRAETERGGLIEHSEQEVDLALKLLALNGGEVEITCEQLKAEGVSVHRNTLARWRKELFPKRYARLRGELRNEISEDVAGRAFERALQADEGMRLYMEKAVQEIDKVEPQHLAKSAQALSMVHSQAIEKGRLLRNEPQSIQETRSVEESLQVLVRLGVVEDETIDGEAEEIE